MTRARLTLLAAGIATLALGVAATRPHNAHAVDTAPHQITVHGFGSVEATPDQVAFSFGVQTSAKTASAALAANGSAAAKVVAALLQAGVVEKSIQTQQVFLSQRRSDDGQTVLGYDASSSVRATLPSIADAGTIIDGAVNAGADSVDGPSLTLSNERALERKALAAAIGDARARAQALADAAGLSVGTIASIAEDGAATPVPFAAKSDAATASAPPIEPGTQEVDASVSVTFTVG
jgi:uncharacterized protein YggE